MENYEQDKLSSIDLQIDNEVRQQLAETSKWTKFISVSMFILAGFILLIGIIAGSLITGVLGKMENAFGGMAELGAGVIIIIIVFIVALMGVVYYFLYRFSTKIKSALATENVIDMNESFNSLKLFFMITTIISIFSLLYSIYTMFKSL
jgi:hypothetical protein